MKIEGKSTVVTATPTVSTTPAYSTGDAIGGLLTLSEAVQFADTGVVLSVVVVDQAKQDVAMDVVFFNSNPSNTTFTDNAALDIADADLLKVCGVVHIATTDWYDFADNSVAHPASKPFVVKVPAGQSLYACLVSRGAPTFAATTDVQLLVGLLQD